MIEQSMEGRVYKPQKLYVLRMNAEGTDAGIEEYDLAQFPELSGRFDEPRHLVINDDWFREWELVGKCVGEERIIQYSTRRSELEWELNQVRQSLREYTESVEKVEHFLKSTGLEDIRHETSKANMTLCSFSDVYYVYGRPFLKLLYRLGHRHKTDAVMTEYDLPCWQIEFFHTGGLSVRQRKKLSDEKKSFDEWMQRIFREPEDFTEKKEEIRVQVEKVYDICIPNDDVLYDPATDCYILKENAEQQMLKGLMPIRDIETDEIAKYTTFDTLVAILQSGKMRMNSIVSMNDKTETDFLEDYIRNYKEEYEREFDKYLFADKEFITSFTTRIDELDMWRLYGDNARGVCMVFERKDKSNDELYKIKYVHPESESLKRVSDLLEALEEKTIRFRMNLLQKNRHFLKQSDYNAEDEYRLLVNSGRPDGWFINRDNGILTPYIERNLKKSEQTVDNKYPFHLSRIILGPAIWEKYANIMQVFYMGHQYGYYLDVSESKIDSYR